MSECSSFDISLNIFLVDRVNDEINPAESNRRNNASPDVTNTYLKFDRIGRFSMFRFPVLSSVLLGLILNGLVHSQENRRKLPRENVIDVPITGKGLSVSNVFQANMVLQRDKPVSIWGWAAAGEDVTVTINGNQYPATAADDSIVEGQTAGDGGQFEATHADHQRGDEDAHSGQHSRGGCLGARRAKQYGIPT